MVRLFSLPLVVMHYDLVDVGAPRDVLNHLSQDRLSKVGLQRLSKTVLATAQESGEAASTAAFRLWQTVAKLTQGKLVHKDRFYLHFPFGAVMATVVEVIGPKTSSLTEDPETDVLNQMGDDYLKLTAGATEG